MIPYSLLDLAPVPEGASVADALRNTTDLAQHAEAWGFRRYWLAEHHNSAGIASAATAVLIGHVASQTTQIRVGAGGIMLPNHAPLMVAEQFGTLATLHPNRIDLGLGRAPGTDPATTHALRRGNERTDRFPDDVRELARFLAVPDAGQAIVATPGAGTNVPLWILGTSLYGASLAAQLGLPYAFGSHFAPNALAKAIEVYRSRFRPNGANPQDRPHLMLAINVFAADTEAEANRLRSSMLQGFIRLSKGDTGPLPPPLEDLTAVATRAEIAMARAALTHSAVGTIDQVRTQIAAFIDLYGPDELILTGHIYDHGARLRSFEIAAQVLSELPAPSATSPGA